MSFCQTKSYSEAYNESNIYRVTLELDCENINALVETDINNKCIFLFLQGGIAPVRYNTDGKFEKNITYITMNKVVLELNVLKITII